MGFEKFTSRVLWFHRISASSGPSQGSEPGSIPGGTISKMGKDRSILRVYRLRSSAGEGG